MLSLFSFRTSIVKRPSAAPHAAGWQSGYAAACKAVDAGSIPTPASSLFLFVERRSAEVVIAAAARAAANVSSAGLACSIP